MHHRLFSSARPARRCATSASTRVLTGGADGAERMKMYRMRVKKVMKRVVEEKDGKGNKEGQVGGLLEA